MQKKNLFTFFLTLFLSFYSSFALAEYQLSICAIFKNDAPWLKEWIEFHKIQGVEHFYLYNNNSDDNYLTVLNPYIINKEVTLVDWNYKYDFSKHKDWLKIQWGAYNDCIQKNKAHTKWLAIIDSDEFLFCPNQEKLPIFLSNFVQYGGVRVNWLCFGTSNVYTIPRKKLMIETLISCADTDKDKHDFVVKSIVQPKYVRTCACSHTCIYNDNYFAVNSNGIQENDTHVSKNLLLDKIRINHYWTRTEKYFIHNKITSRLNRRLHDTGNKLKALAKTYNVTTDEAILPFVEELRKNMGY